LAIIQWTDVTASRPQEGVGVFIHDHLTTPRWGGMARRSTADQMIDRTPTRGNYNRFDLMIAIGFAALVAVWLLIYAVLLVKYGGYSG